MQSQEGDKAEAYLRKGVLALMPDHGDANADLAVALSMQAVDDLEKVKEAFAAIEKARELGASGVSFDRRRWAERSGRGIAIFTVREDA